MGRYDGGNPPGNDKGNLATTIYGDHVLGTDGDDGGTYGMGEDQYIGLLDMKSGRDLFNGFKGDDQAYGGADDDNLHGQNGDDTLIGGTGADEIAGGGDSGMSDHLAGGDWIDFVPGEDDMAVCVDENGYEIWNSSSMGIIASVIEFLNTFESGDVVWAGLEGSDTYYLVTVTGGFPPLVFLDGVGGSPTGPGGAATRGAWGTEEGDTWADGWRPGDDPDSWVLYGSGGEFGEIVGTSYENRFDLFDEITDDGDPDTFTLEKDAVENGHDYIYNFEEAEWDPGEMAPANADGEPGWEITDMVDAHKVDFDWGDAADGEIPTHEFGGEGQPGVDDRGAPLSSGVYDGEGCYVWTDEITPYELEDFIWYDGENGQLHIDLNGDGEDDEGDGVVATFVEMDGLGSDDTSPLSDNVVICVDLPVNTLTVYDFVPGEGEIGVCVDENGYEIWNSSFLNPAAAIAEAEATFSEGDVFWGSIAGGSIYFLATIDGGEVVFLDGVGGGPTDPLSAALRGAWGADPDDTYAGGWIEEGEAGQWNLYGSGEDFGEVFDTTWVGYIDDNDEITHTVETEQVYAVWDQDHWDFVDVA